MTCSSSTSLDLTSGSSMSFVGVPDTRCVLQFPTKKPNEVPKSFASVWVKHYGMPEMLITDQGGEFVGSEFTTYVAQHGGLQHFIDSHSPWQQGRAERAGASLKEDLRDVVRECAIVTESELEIAISDAVDARNRYPSRSGYSDRKSVV